MHYLTYEEYKKIGGTLEETAFIRNIHRACGEINARTKNRIISMAVIPEEVKELCRDLVEYFSANITLGAVVTSKSSSSGSVSESESYSVKSQESISDELADMFNAYLSCLTDDNGTPLLYRGCGI